MSERNGSNVRRDARIAPGSRGVLTCIDNTGHNRQTTLVSSLLPRVLF